MRMDVPDTNTTHLKAQGKMCKDIASKVRKFMY